LLKVVTGLDHDVHQLPGLEVAVDGTLADLLLDLGEGRIEESVDVAFLALDRMFVFHAQVRGVFRFVQHGVLAFELPFIQTGVAIIASGTISMG
jgi:hypothetical protein